METKLSKALDESIVRIRQGEAIETCLAEYPDLRERLEPLLFTVLSISAVPKISPSDDFRRTSQARLMARLRRESIQAKTTNSYQRPPLLPNRLAMLWQGVRQSITVTRKVAIPVSIVLLLALGASLYQLGVFNILPSVPVLASPSTLSILSGSAEIQNTEADSWQPGTDGMFLATGTRVKTGVNSHVLLTFFEGSTIKLSPETDIEIQQLKRDDDQASTIILKQSMGKTWSHVVKTANLDSYYQILTPSASTIAYGTLFMTEVNESGFTRVATTQGLVSVVAQDEEVQLPAGQQTHVEGGMAPSQPVTISIPKAELVIKVNAPALGSVSDPTGSSTGRLPTGFIYNQITGSQYQSLSNDTHLINIPEPIDGQYFVVLRYTAPGSIYFNIQGKSEGNVIFEYDGTIIASKNNEWIIPVNLDVYNGSIVGGAVGDIEPLVDESPEHIVETELDEGTTVPIEPPSQDKNS